MVVIAVMEAATGVTALAADAVLSEMVSVLPVMTAATVATSLSATETALLLLMLSEVVGVLAVIAAVDVASPLPTEAVLSL